MRRIVLLNDRIPPESTGGAGKIVWGLALGLRAAGHDVQVIAATERETFHDIRDGIPTYHLHTSLSGRWRAYYALRNPQIIPALRDLLVELQPDVVNAHNVHEALSYHSLALSNRQGAAVVLTAHDVMAFAYGKLTHYIDPPLGCEVATPDAYRLPLFYNLRQMRLRFNPLRNPIIRQVQRRHVHAQISVSEALQQALAANRLPGYRVVHNGLPLDVMAASSQAVTDLRVELGLAGRRVILFGGRMAPTKGGPQILAAMDRLVQSMPDAVLLVLSARPVQAHNLARFPHLGPASVISGGWLTGERLAAAYQLADVITVPSVCFDSLPTMILEAMATGRPVVATCFGGAPEMVIDGETGYLVNPFDAETFAGRLAHLLNNTDARAQMGVAGRARFEAKFTLDRQVEGMVAVYEDALTIKRG